MIRELVILILLTNIATVFATVPSNNIVKNTPTVFTYQTKQDIHDKRYNYDYELLELSLEKTKNSYGPFILVPLFANYKRVEDLALKVGVKNIIFKKSVSMDRLNKFGYIPFPVDLGIVGYRVGFISKQNKNKIQNITSLEVLKKLSILQGEGWLDNKILKHNAFTVITGKKYAYLFKMISNNRADMFMRGANELYSEWQTNKNISKLSYDKTLALYYPLPRFFFTSKENTHAINRINEGLIQAYKDGSLQKLWKKHYQKSIDFVNLNKRKIFKIENPFLEGMDKSYEQYIYTPK